MVSSGRLRSVDCLKEKIRDHSVPLVRRILARQSIPQPPDFPVHRHEPAHLKTVWLQIAATRPKSSLPKSGVCLTIGGNENLLIDKVSRHESEMGIFSKHEKSGP
jgi:hypothetical protein